MNTLRGEVAIFAAESAAECPPELRPSWMYAHHPLSVPEVLVSTKDPAIRQQWRDDARRQRDHTVRLFTLEDRPLIPGPVLFRAHRQTTPAAALSWFGEFAGRPGHRYVLLDPAAPDRCDDLLDTTEEEGCDVCDETRPSLAYEAHRKHQERAS